MDTSPLAGYGITESMTSHTFINYGKFLKGKFVLKRSKHAVLSVAMYLTNKRNDIYMKGVGGVVGLTENSATLHHCVVSDPKMAHLVGEFQGLLRQSKTQMNVTMNRRNTYK